MAEVVYVLTNQAMPGLVKIGRTTDDLAFRIRQLFTTAVPVAFELYYACEVSNSQFVEAQLHKAFGDHRYSTNREFFEIAPERVRAALSLAQLREVRLGDEIFESQEDKADVEAVKRRSRFQFALVGISPGTELQLLRDPSIVCRTVDDRNKVEFRGDITSLSDAGLRAVRELGFDWPTVSGPWEWAYQGKRLDDLRREIEAKAD